MIKRFIIIVLILISTINIAIAQYDPSFSHYWAMNSSFNPSAIGLEKKLTINASYALDFIGYKNNPNTLYISSDMPLHFFKQLHSVGFTILNDKIGLFTHQRLSGQYAIKKKIFKGELSIGIQAGMILEKFNGNKIDLEDANDPAFINSEINGQSLDIGTGLYYSYKNWHIGLSVQHLNSPTINLGERNEIKINKSYYLNGGYNIKTNNPFLSIPIFFLARYENNIYRADFTSIFRYTNEKKTMYCGLTYSPSISVTAFIGGNINNISIGYSYEFYTRTVALSNGSHGLFVSYQTDVNLKKRSRNKHKSVRFL